MTLYANKRSRSGFTLIELLLVVALIAIAASAGFVQLVERDDQARYEATKEGYANLRKSIVGSGDSVVLNGALVQRGFLYDTGSLPATLDNLVNRSDTAEWGIIGHELVNSGDTFSSEIFPHIRIKSGWRGPYFVRSDRSNQPLLDGWGNEYVYIPPSAGNNTISLFSKGKGNQIDVPGSDRAQDDEIGYEEDYPQENERNINSHEYEVTEVSMPKALRILIPQTEVDSDNERNKFHIAVIYPGLDLSQQTFGGLDPNSPEALLAAHNCVRVGPPNNPLINFSELEEEAPFVDTTTSITYSVFRLETITEDEIQFQIPNCLRYQIAVVNSDRNNSSKVGQTTIADHLVSVYPTIYTFTDGQPPPISEEGLFDWNLNTYGQTQ